MNTVRVIGPAGKGRSVQVAKVFHRVLHENADKDCQTTPQQFLKRYDTFKFFTSQTVQNATSLVNLLSTCIHYPRQISLNHFQLQHVLQIPNLNLMLSMLILTKWSVFFPPMRFTISISRYLIMTILNLLLLKFLTISIQDLTHFMPDLAPRFPPLLLGRHFLCPPPHTPWPPQPWHQLN